MKSATSSSRPGRFYPALWKKNMARFWPLWAVFGVFWLFVVPLTLLTQDPESTILYVDSFALPGPAYFAQITILDLLSSAGVFSTLIFGTLAAMAVFSYLYSSRSVDFFHALPVSRDGLFLTNVVSGYSFLALPTLAVALVIASRSRWGKLAALCAAGTGVIALGMTYNRASWIGGVAAAGVFVFLWNRKLIPGLLLLGICALPVLPDTIFNRILTIFNLKDTSTSSRFPLYAAALEMIKTRPIRGAGLGTDVVRLAIKDMNLYHGAAPFVHAHNLYLQIWLETGLIGLLSYLAAMISALKAAAKACKLRCPQEVRLITIGAAAAVAGILVDCLADYLWNYPRVMVVFWFLFAILLSGVKLARRAAQRGETGGARP